MGVLIKIDGVIFDPEYIIGAVDVPDEPVTIAEYPVQDTLMGLYDLGGTLEDSLVNRAPADNVTAETEVAALPSPTTLTDDSVTANYVQWHAERSACVDKNQRFARRHDHRRCVVPSAYAYHPDSR